MHEAETFQQDLLGALLGLLEARPALPMPEANNLVPNLGVLLELVEDQAAAAPALLERSAALLNLIACHNSPTVPRPAQPAARQPPHRQPGRI